MASDRDPPPTDTPPVPPPAMSPNVASPGQQQDEYRSGGSWGPVPVMLDGMTYSEIGASGLRAFSGWVREEFLQSLVGRQGAQKYREMLDNSPIIGAIMFAIYSTMRKVEWRTIPANDSGDAQEMADFVDSCREDMSHTWQDHIVEALSMLGYGYAPHEIVYKKRLGLDPGDDPNRPGKSLPTSDYDDGRIGWRRLPLRGQDTVLKWFFDPNGEIQGMTQQPWIGPLIDIPIEKMLLFRPYTHKNNPEGRSILRTAYISYYYVKRLQEQEAILAERLGGIPVIYVPSELMEAAKSGDANAVSALNMFKKIAVNTRIDEQMGLVLPSNPYVGTTGPSSVMQYKFELVAPQHRASSFDFDKTITRYNISMMTSVLADFLQLGHESRGTQSLAVNKVDMFFQAVESFLNGLAAVYNRFAIPRLWKLNAFNPDLMPKLEPDLAQRVDLDVLSNFVLRLSQAGMPLFPNDELQSYILDAGGLPDVQDDRALQAAGLLDEQLGRSDDKEQAVVDRMQAMADQSNQPSGQPNGKAPMPSSPGQNNLEKMLLASIARRIIKLSGPRLGLRTRRVKPRRRAA